MLYIEVDIDFTSADGPDIHSTESNAFSFSLTITMSPDTAPSLTGVVNIPSHTVAHIPVAEGSAVRLIVRANAEAMELTSVTALVSPLCQKGDLPIASGSLMRPVADSPMRETDTTLRRAEEAMNAIDTWKSAVNVMKWVMDTITPIAAV
jgi:hypothetical protein